MRVALVSTPFVSVPPRGYGGTELVVHELVQELTAAGHAVTLFATGDSVAPDLRFLYARAVWPPRPDADASHCAAVAASLLHERFDIIHAHLPGLLARADGLGAPVVYTIHHPHDDSLSRTYARHPSVRFVAISNRQAELEPLLRCDVVHHGLDPARYPQGRGEGGYALFLGRLVPCKAPDLAVAAARAAGVRLRIAGRFHSSDSTQEWRAMLERALRSPGVEWVGPVGGPQKTALIGAARALLMPLRWEEPFGLVMVEAMLSGTPVIAFPRGAAPELVEEGVTGFFVRDADEMAARLSRLHGFDRIACRRRAQQRFSRARMARDYERIYAAAACGTAWSTEGPRYAG